jgi:hypothetical protein
VAVEEHARYPTIEYSRIGAVVFLGTPSSDRFVSLDETLQPKSHGIVSSATVTAANWIFLVQAILESRGIGHLNLLALRKKNGDEERLKLIASTSKKPGSRRDGQLAFALRFS